MWTRRGSEHRLQAELRYHFERLVEDLIAEGVDPAAARRRAQLEFGGIPQIAEECRDVRGHWLEDLAKDLRYTARTLRQSPAFLMVAVLSLALGIGANTAIFTLIDAIMLRSLPVQQPERLVQITRLSQDGKPTTVSYPLFEYFHDNLKSISGAAVAMASGSTIHMDGVEEEVSTDLVSGEFYSLLGLAPAAGRLLQPADDAASPAQPAAVLSYRYWDRRFGRDPAAIGRTFTFLDHVYTIVGVAPERFHGTTAGRDPDLTMPVTTTLSLTQRREDSFNLLDLIARLAPGVSAKQADAEVQVVWQQFRQRLAAAVPGKSRPAILRQRAGVVPAANGFTGLFEEYSKALLVLMGIVGLVLLLACANLSGLLLARAASRQREISIRLALGASGGRLVRQFMAESLVLAALGGGAGLLLAQWFNSVLLTLMANGRTLELSTAADGRVLAFTLAISLAACVLAGLAPGLHALRANLNPGLKSVRADGHQRIGKMLVVAQLAISMVLLVGAALFVGTLVKLYRVDPGVRTDGVAMFHVRFTRYPEAQSLSVRSALLERLRALPGVASASAGQLIPAGGGIWTRTVQVEGYRFRPEESEEVAFNVVAPRYFATLGTPLLAGREFDDRDTGTAPKVAIVNQSFARYFFGNQSPLGRRVTSLNVTYEIVGVAKDTRYFDLRHEAARTLYTAWMQRPGDQPSNYYYFARVAAGDAARLWPLFNPLVRAVDPSLRLRTQWPPTYTATIAGELATERIMAILGAFFGVLALLVACLGIFGVMAFQVSRRVNEIGLRMALGASRGGIVSLVMREVAAMLAVGSLAGAAAARALTGLAGSMLYGMAPSDPAIFLLAAVVLSLAALAAAWFPARRASLVDPMAALRHE